MPLLDDSSIDVLLARADIGSAPGRGAKLAPGINAQLSTVAVLARELPLDCESPGFVHALAQQRPAEKR